MQKREEKLPLGERVADLVAKFGGSWMAIFSCSGLIIVWIVINTWVLNKPLDPFPYILLNLVLSCVAALQAPFILMANARQELADRKRSEKDLAIDTKSEKEIREVLKEIKALRKELSSTKQKTARTKKV